MFHYSYLFSVSLNLSLIMYLSNSCFPPFHNKIIFFIHVIVKLWFIVIGVAVYLHAVLQLEPFQIADVVLQEQSPVVDLLTAHPQAPNTKRRLI